MADLDLLVAPILRALGLDGPAVDFQLVRETGLTLEFSDSTAVRRIGLALGGAAVPLGVLSLLLSGGLRLDPSTARALLGACLIFGVYCVHSALRKEDIRIDLVGRRYDFLKGYAWALKTWRSGALGELRGVILCRVIWRGRSGNAPFWMVSLSFDGARSLSVQAVDDEAEGYRRFESLARTLRCDAIDLCGPEKRRSWDALDAPCARESAPVALPPPPIGILLRGERGRRLIALRRPKIGLVVKFFLALLFLGIMSIGVGHWTLLDNVVLLPVVFLLAVLRAREAIRESGDALEFGWFLGGVFLRTSRIVKVDIKDINIRLAGDGEFHEIGVRGERKVVTLGKTLAPSEKEWLRAFLFSLLT